MQHCQQLPLLNLKVRNISQSLGDNSSCRYKHGNISYSVRTSTLEVQVERCRNMSATQQTSEHSPCLGPSRQHDCDCEVVVVRKCSKSETVEKSWIKGSTEPGIRFIDRLRQCWPRPFALCDVRPSSIKV